MDAVLSEPNTTTISPNIKAIFESLRGRVNPLQPIAEEDLIKINSITSTAGTLYEKFRYLLDYKDEHTIKRSAIARILRRKVIIEGETNVGLSMLQELITGGYLPNNSVPERISAQVQTIVDKYLLLRNRAQAVSNANKMIVNFAANEINDLLFPVVADEVVLEAFFLSVRERIKIFYEISPDELDIELYVACRRGLLREDNDGVSYALWRRFSKWNDTMSDDDIGLLAQHFPVIQHRIIQALTHVLGWDLVPKLKNETLYFSVLKEVVNAYGVEAETVLTNEEYLGQYVKTLLQEHYAKENAKTTRSAIRAIFYVFCTKVLLALGLELPYEYYVLGAINFIPLGANVVFHPLLLFLMTRIKPLGDRNTSLILAGLRKSVYGEDRTLIKVKKLSWGVLNAFFTFLYFGLFLVSFSILVWLLYELQFNIASTVLFLFFLTLVSYFGLRIRHNAQRWRVRTGEEGMLVLLWNVFTLPIVRAGRWLSRTFSSINVFVFFLDFIIEAPFKLLLSLSDAFTSFLREKREETV